MINFAYSCGLSTFYPDNRYTHWDRHHRRLRRQLLINCNLESWHNRAEDQLLKSLSLWYTRGGICASNYYQSFTLQVDQSSSNLIQIFSQRFHDFAPQTCASRNALLDYFWTLGNHRFWDKHAQLQLPYFYRRSLLRIWSAHIANCALGNLLKTQWSIWAK